MSELIGILVLTTLPVWVSGLVWAAFEIQDRAIDRALDREFGPARESAGKQ
jgi:hypothetical protein